MEDTRMIAIFAIASFAMYFGLGYGAAAIFRGSLAWRIGAGIAVPAALFAACWFYDLNNPPRGIIHIPARTIWCLPGMLLLRLFIPR